MALCTRSLFLALAICCASFGVALAQEPGADLFVRMDTDGDGKVTAGEFRSAYPNMNQNAFVMIDSNGDGVIEQGEWNIFTATHARQDRSGPERGAPMNNIPGDPLIPPVDSNDLPLMRPPGM